MSVEGKAIRSVTWLAAFETAGRVFSWAATVVVARILVPQDYGLMALATVYTAYAEIFSEMGLGTSIIQRQETTREELSSVFWFSFVISLGFALLCLPLSYFTAATFREPRVIPLTQAVALVFLLNGLQIVPLNLLRKALAFREIGSLNFFATLAACGTTLAMARMGFGVWSLLGGTLARGLVRTALSYVHCGWWPTMHFHFGEARFHLSFGLTVSFSRSLGYIFSNSDRFFAGRLWGSQMVGYYTFALTLAQLPTERITNLINQVSFSAFARLQDDQPEFNRYYLNMIRLIATLVMPLFGAGFLLAEPLVLTVLGTKWAPIIFVFRFLCLAQVVTSLSAINDFVHNAQGRPRWGLTFSLVLALFMPLSFWAAARHGLNAMPLAWGTTYVVICAVWTVVTLRKIGIPLGAYLARLARPLGATLVMGLAVVLGELAWSRLPFSTPAVGRLVALGVVGGAAYAGSLLWFDRSFFRDLRALWRRA